MKNFVYVLLLALPFFAFAGLSAPNCVLSLDEENSRLLEPQEIDCIFQNIDAVKHGKRAFIHAKFYGEYELTTWEILALESKELGNIAQAQLLRKNQVSSMAITLNPCSDELTLSFWVLDKTCLEIRLKLMDQSV